MEKSSHGSAMTYSTWMWSWLQTPVLLVVIGLFSAFTSYLISFSSDLSEYLKWSLSRSEEEGYLIWGIYAVWCVLLAVLSLYVTSTFCPQAAGGGLVDMKVILSGHSPQGSSVLALHLIPTKVLGLMLALASGLSVGKEGPLVQVTAAFATYVMNAFGDLFTRVRFGDSYRLDILACACAAGISSTFGATYGGVLYSLEVLCINSSSKNIPKAYLSCICSMLVFFWLGAKSHVSLYMRAKKENILTNQENNHDETKEFKADEIMLSMLLGLFCGILGSMFNTLLGFVCTVRSYLFRPSLPRHDVLLRQYAVVIVVALLISPLTYEEEGFGIRALTTGPEPLVDVVFRYQPIELTPRVFFYFPFKFLVTILCITLPIPAGLFDPVFLLGGVFGRIIGTVLSYYPSLAPAVSPREFALIGAAAFSTAVTRAVSTTVIVYELSGHRHIHLPLSAAVVTAYFVGNRFSKSAYDTILESGRFKEQLVPEIPPNLLSTPIKSVLQNVGDGGGMHACLYLNCTIRDALELVEEFERCIKLDPESEAVIPSEVPVLESVARRYVVGSVKLRHLRKAIKLYKTKAQCDDGIDDEVIFLKRDNSYGRVKFFILQATCSNGKRSPNSDKLISEIDEFGDESTDSLKKGWVWEILDESRLDHISLNVTVQMDSSPHQVDEELPLKKAAELMCNLKLDQIIVTSCGKYLGFVGRSELSQYVQFTFCCDQSEHYSLFNSRAYSEVWGFFKSVLAKENYNGYSAL